MPDLGDFGSFLQIGLAPPPRPITAFVLSCVPSARLLLLLLVADVRFCTSTAQLREMPTGLLSSTSVLLCSTGFTSAYLGSIYLLPSTRIALPAVPPPPSSSTLFAEDADPIAATEATPPRDRNHPSVIRARLVAVSVASLASCAALPLLLTHNDPFTYPTWRTAVPTALRLLGLGARPTAKSILYPLGLTASLFAGSLYVSWLAGELPGQRGSRTWADWRAKFDGWRGVRTYILVRTSNQSRLSGLGL